MSRKYIGLLAIAAALVITVGLLIRPRDHEQAPAPSAETLPLQRLSQEVRLRDEATYYGERIEAVAQQVVFVMETNASGVRWAQSGEVVTTLPSRPVVLARAGTSDDGDPAVPVAELPLRPRWLLVVAARAGGRPISAVGRYGGITATRCGDSAFQEIVLDIALHPALAGAGLFDLNGSRLGVVVHCGNRLIAIPASEVERELTELRSLSGRLRSQLGIAVAQLEDDQRAYFGVDSGVVVIAIENAGVNGASPLQPGDVIVAIDGAAVRRPDDLRPLIAGSSAGEHVVTRIRDGRREEVRLGERRGTPPAAASPGDSVGLAMEGGGITLTRVPAASAAQRAGLREGDRIVKVGGANSLSVASVRRALRTAETAPVFIVVQRDSTRRGFLLSPR